jgi:hypothetical protein
MPETYSPSMPEIKHIVLDYSLHFLVVDGTRGEPCHDNDKPAMHPSGYGRFRDDAYNLPDALKGKVFKIVDVAVDQEKIDQCEPAQKAYREYSEITNECHRINIARYDAAPELVKSKEEEVA